MWKQKTLTAVVQGLRKAAEEGRFVPGHWIYDTDHPDDGDDCDGCGQGIIAWIVSRVHFGIEETRRLLPVGCELDDVIEVLMAAGITEDEIRSMTMINAFEHFDRELIPAYDNRRDDPDAFIAKSVELAGYFERVVRRVPVESTVSTQAASSALSPAAMHGNHGAGLPLAA